MATFSQLQDNIEKMTEILKKLQTVPEGLTKNPEVDKELGKAYSSVQKVYSLLIAEQQLT